MQAVRRELFPSEEAILDELKTQNKKAVPVETNRIIIDNKAYEYSLSDFETKVYICVK